MPINLRTQNSWKIARILINANYFLNTAAKNLETKKSTKAAKIIFFTVLLIGLLFGLIYSPSFRILVLKHPGLIGVLIGVAGEVYFDWGEEVGTKGRWKKFFMALLVVSLAYELVEASETDKEAADTIKLAGLANERAATNEVIAVGLAKEVLLLTQQIQDAAKTANETREKLGDANTQARLNETKSALDLANKVATDVRSIVTNSNLAELKNFLPWKLSPSQVEVFSNSLVGSPRGAVDFTYPYGNEDSYSLALQIHDLLKQFGYSTRELYWYLGSDFDGIGIEISDPQQQPAAAGFIQRALIKAGVPAAGKVDSMAGALSNSTTLIRIGIKPKN
ncbi:MAG TPA: hypothetical protein VNN22_03325 [Verrucomicrobiae bacterium]|nr:hypothetical protein [Verrucomicrobiae bacterium]